MVYDSRAVEKLLLRFLHLIVFSALANVTKNKVANYGKNHTHANEYNSKYKKSVIKPRVRFGNNFSIDFNTVY